MLIIVSVACSTLVYQTDVCKHAQHPRIPTGLHCFEPNACISFLFSTTHHPPLHPCSVVARVLTAKERQGVDEPSHELQHPMMRDHRTMPSPQHWLVPHSYPSVSLPLPVKLCGRFAIPGSRLRQIRPFFDVDASNKKFGGKRFEPATPRSNKNDKNGTNTLS